MQEKGFVDHKVFGNSRQYYPKVKKADYFSKHMNGMIKNFFNNAALQFASLFTKSAKFSAVELEELRKIIDQEIEKKKKLITYIIKSACAPCCCCWYTGGYFIVSSIYAAVSLILLVHFILNLLRIKKITSGEQSTEYEGAQLILTEKRFPRIPFSDTDS